MELWNQAQEKQFFGKYLKKVSPEKLFYSGDDNRYYAYWPRTYKSKKDTQQARNSLIGEFTEQWCVNLLGDFASSKNAYAVNKVVCEELALSKTSPADVAICKTDKINQNPEDILLIIEVKMSLVWNWELIQPSNKLICLGDYKTHKGNPGLLRSDTVLKAIGKSLDIRISSPKAARIPIIILGNTPITEHYYEKVDKLKNNGVIQGFWSLNSCPLSNNSEENLKNTHDFGFIRFDSHGELNNRLNQLLSAEREYFSATLNKKDMGKFIELANIEVTYERKAEKFLSLIREQGASGI